jgi:hypothetical protein
LDGSNQVHWVNFPFIDPISGGNSRGARNAPTADTLPFYWDEIPRSSGIALVNNIFDNREIRFFDEPLSTWGSSFYFDTYLVSVPGDPGQTSEREFTVLAGFTWKFTASPFDSATRMSNQITGLRAISSLDGQIAGIDGLLANFPGWRAGTLGSETLAPASSDPTTSVPEPDAVFGWLGVGVFGVALRLLRP